MDNIHCLSPKQAHKSELFSIQGALSMSFKWNLQADSHLSFEWLQHPFLKSWQEQPGHAQIHNCAENIIISSFSFYHIILISASSIGSMLFLLLT